MRRLLSAVLCLVGASICTPELAKADDFVTAYETTASFGDASADLEDAIINRGYVVENHGNIGDMLKRTADAVGATRTIYRHAEFFEFCSAVVSRAMMEAEISNIAFCPLSLFVYEAEGKPGTVVVGFRRLPAGDGRDKVNDALDAIAREAAGR